MKKLMTLGAALIAGAVFADVTSSTIVGYNTISVGAGKQIALTVAFEKTAGGSVDITNLISTASQNSSSSFGSSADQIWRWDNTNSRWKQYFLSVYNKRKGTVNGWCTKESEGMELTNDSIPAGETFFYRNGGSSTQAVTLSGAVKIFSASPSYTVGAGNQCFMGYPWPVGLPIVDFAKFQSVTNSSSSFGSSADQIWRWDSANSCWKQYFFSAYNKRKGTVDGWCTRESAGLELASEVVIEPGEGFFFRNGGSSTETINFSYPISE